MDTLIRDLKKKLDEAHLDADLFEIGLDDVAECSCCRVKNGGRKRDR